MKRDMDLVRDILLVIEAANEPPRMSDLNLTNRGEHHEELVAYHMQMLIQEAGLVRGVDASSMGHDEWLNLEITWQGHEFLEAVRDPETWRRTKEGAGKVGNFAISFLADVAKAYAKHIAKERLGLDL